MFHFTPLIWVSIFQDLNHVIVHENCDSEFWILETVEMYWLRRCQVELYPHSAKIVPLSSRYRQPKDQKCLHVSQRVVDNYYSLRGRQTMQATETLAVQLKDFFIVKQSLTIKDNTTSNTNKDVSHNSSFNTDTAIAIMAEAINFIGDQN